MKVLETLARAACYADECRRPDCDEMGKCCAARVHLADEMVRMRAVLLALRSPDEGMVEAMAFALDQNPKFSLEDDARCVLQAAIDHILTSEAGK